MPLRKFKPTSPGRRFMTSAGFEEITTDEPEKSLVESLPTHAGRNNQGRITTRHQGGGYRKLYRKIDFKRDKHGIAGRVATIEYDPNRSARIALIHYKDGEKRYILARNLNIRDLFTHTYLLLAKDCLELLEDNFGRPESRSRGKAAEVAE